MNNAFPTLDAIRAAHDRIKPYIHRTPILTSEYFNELTGCRLYFKCENFQKVGAFKARGAFNAILRLDSAALQHGVATHSSGNHAQAVALGAKVAGTKAWIVMPNNAPQVKKDAVKGYGATVIECEPTIEARERTLAKVIAETGAQMIHPYNDDRIITGQATAAVELLADCKEELDTIITPVGGGGLLSGTALASYYLAPDTEVLGAEPRAADDAYRSLKSGQLQTNTSPPKTMADGLLTNLGERNFHIIKAHVNDILLADEGDIAQALKLIIERMKIVIEPSCAVPLAAVLAQKDRFLGKRIGIVLSGGNVDVARLASILEQYK